MEAESKDCETFAFHEMIYCKFFFLCVGVKTNSARLRNYFIKR
jgi:hypothetical protein